MGRPPANESQRVWANCRLARTLTHPINLSFNLFTHSLVTHAHALTDIYVIIYCCIIDKEEKGKRFEFFQWRSWTINNNNSNYKLTILSRISWYLKFHLFFFYFSSLSTSDSSADSRSIEYNLIFHLYRQREKGKRTRVITRYQVLSFHPFFSSFSSF